MQSTRSDWLVAVLLILLSAIPAVSGSFRLAELASGAAVTPENARFHAAPLPVVLHVTCAILFSVVGALQFAPGFRRLKRGWHRAAGWLLAPCGLLVALTGLWMAHFYPWPTGDGYLVYGERLVFGTAMLASLVIAPDAIRRRDFASHGAWMIRAYAIGLGAGTQVLTHLPWFLLSDARPGELARGVMMGAGWMINVVVAEWIIARGKGAGAGASNRGAAPPVQAVETNRLGRRIP